MKKLSEKASLDVAVIDLLKNYVEKENISCPGFVERANQLSASSRVSVEDWWQLIEELQQINPRDDLGLVIGTYITPQYAGVLGYLAMYSDTIGQAFQRFHKFQPLLHNFVPSRFYTNAESMVLGWEPSRVSTQLSDDILGAGLICLMRQLTGVDDFGPTLMRNPRPRPKNYLMYERFYGCKIEFGSAVNEIVFASAISALPINTKDPYLFSIIDRQAEAMLKGLPQEDPLLEKVQSNILHFLQDGSPDMSQVSQRMGLPERSLYRALNERGVRFKELVNNIRFELAKDYLRDDDLSLAEVALLLGFADQSIFSRAFKGWSGTSPLQWKKRPHAS